MMEVPLRRVSAWSLGSSPVEPHIEKQEHTPLLKSMEDATCRSEDKVQLIAHAAVPMMPRLGIVAAMDPAHVVSAIGERTGKEGVRTQT